MKISNIFLGIILTTVGAMIVYIDYFIVSIFYDVSLWIANNFNAPESFSILTTLILVIIFVGIIIAIAIIAPYIFLLGLRMLYDN